MEIGKEIFYLQTKCLSIMGHTLTPELRKSKYLLLLLVASAEYPMLNYAIYNRDNMELVTGCLTIYLVNLASVIQILAFFVKKAKFMEIMIELKNMWENSDEFASNYLKLSNKKADRVVKYYFYSICFTAYYFMLFPIAKIAWATIFKLPVVRELPITMRFFFDSESTPGYEFAYIFTGCVVYIVVAHIVIVDGLFIAFVFNIRAHFQLLQQNIENNSFDQNENAINVDICNYVKYHLKLLSITDKLCQAYAPVIFGVFALTSLQICVLIYQLLTKLDDAVRLTVYGTFMASVLVHLFIYCYAGEMLKVENSMVGNSIQISNYYNLQPKQAKMLCLILIRSQRDIIVKAGVYVASLENFMMIVKAAMSYITLIQSMEQI